MSILLILSKIAELDAIRKHERTGRTLGRDNFLSLLEEKIGRISKKQKPGPKRTELRGFAPIGIVE